MGDIIDRDAVLALTRDPFGGETVTSQAIAAMPAVTVGVKPLVWHEAADGNHKKGECFTTRSPISFAPIAAHKKHDGWWLNIDCITYPTLDAAKSAAQADYEARILAALEPVTPAPDAAIREAAQSLLDLHDGFLAGKDVDKAAADRLAVASCFGAEAFMACPVAGAEPSAMTRAFLLALVNPLHPDLDYLRAGSRVAITEKPHDCA